MAQAVIADAGPLIALAGTDVLEVLPGLFDEIRIPMAVERECMAKKSLDAQRIESDRRKIAMGNLPIRWLRAPSNLPGF